ncbi:hypothetical protein ACQ4PT_017128 [Festuca glaucescens]
MMRSVAFATVMLLLVAMAMAHMRQQVYTDEDERNHMLDLKGVGGPEGAEARRHQDVVDGEKEAEPPVATSPTSCTATKTDDAAPWMTSSPLTVHNRCPSTPLHVDLDDAIILSSGCVISLLGIDAAWNVADITKGSSVVIFGLATVGLYLKVLGYGELPRLLE